MESSGNSASVDHVGIAISLSLSTQAGHSRGLRPALRACSVIVGSRFIACIPFSHRFDVARGPLDLPEAKCPRASLAVEVISRSLQNNTLESKAALKGALPLITGSHRSLSRTRVSRHFPVWTDTDFERQLLLEVVADGRSNSSR